MLNSKLNRCSPILKNYPFFGKLAKYLAQKSL